MPYAAVVFDLDGTLADTLDDLVAACNNAIGHFGLPPIERERYRYLVGQGVGYLVEHALATGGPGYAQHIDEATRLHVEGYREHMYDRSGPYPGVPEMLDALTAAQVKLAVLSNKPQQATGEMVGHMFRNWKFDTIWGHRDGYDVKPDPASARALIAELDLAPEQVVYVGDTQVDMHTGKAAGFLTVGVTWGFRDEAELRDNGADHIIHEPSQLVAIVAG